MDRIAEIIDHIKLADRSEATASEHNWAASQLIWEETHDKKGRTQKEIAAAIGKSETHVSFMKKCWKVKVIDTGIEGFSLRALGSFYDMYNSEQVRGEASGGGGGSGHKGNKREHEPGEQELDENTARGAITKAANLLYMLRKNPAYWPMLTDDDIVTLREAINDGRAILAGLKQAK